MTLFFLILYSLYFFSVKTFPAPEFLVFPYLVNSGLMPYSQIIDQHMPGLFLLPINFAKLGFESFESFRLIILLLSIIQGLFIIKITRLLKKGNEFYSILILFILTIIFEIFSLWYESFLVLTVITSVYFSLRGKYTLSFLLFGLSIIFKQTAILYLLPLGLYSLYKNGIAKSIKYIGISLCPIILLVLYYYSNNVLSDFVYWTVRFNIDTYAKLAIQPPSSRIMLLIAGIVGLNLLEIFKMQNYKSLLIFLFSLISLIGAFIRYSPTQLILFISFSAILLSQLLSNKNPFKYVISIILLIYSIHLGVSNKYVGFNYYSSDIQEISNRINAISNKNEEIFILGGQPHIYQLSETLPVGKYFSYQLPWYTNVNINKIETNFSNNKPEIVLVDKEANIDGINISNQFNKINTIISKEYKLLESYKNYEIYKLKN